MAQGRNPVNNWEQWGPSVDGIQDDAPILQKALDDIAALGGGELRVTGRPRLVGDVRLTGNDVRLVGQGQDTVLAFEDGGLIVDAVESGHTMRRFGLADFRVTRTGTTGPAIWFRGVSQGPVSTWRQLSRWGVSDVHVLASTGPGWLLHDTYLGRFDNCYALSCDIGWEIVRADSTGVNSVQWFGGETQGCRIGVSAEAAYGCSWFGHAVEGCSESGIDIRKYSQGLLITGAWFEHNGPAVTGRDIRVGQNGAARQITVAQSYFRASTDKDHAIEAWNVNNLHVGPGNLFFTYGVTPVANSEATAGDVRGRVWLNTMWEDQANPAGPWIENPTAEFYELDL